MLDRSKSAPGLPEPSNKIEPDGKQKRKGIPFGPPDHTWEDEAQTKAVQEVARTKPEEDGDARRQALRRGTRPTLVNQRLPKK